MLINEEKTQEIIRCFYKVYNTLGYGFLEKVYENALLSELNECGFNCAKQIPVKVYYNSKEVGFYISDIIIDEEIIIEIKAGAGGIITAHEKQLINYLKATDFELGYIFHFGEKPTFKRQIFNSEYKRRSV